VPAGETGFSGCGLTAGRDWSELAVGRRAGQINDKENGNYTTDFGTE